MKRSIIQLGGKTYVVSLPLSWINKIGLKKKDEVEVTERGEELIVTPKNNTKKRKISIKIKKKTRGL